MKLKLATLAVTSVLALNAQAQSTFGGQHKPVEIATALVPVGQFDHLYNFSLANPVGTFSSAVALNNAQGILDILLINGGKVLLFKDAGATDTQVGDFTFDGTTGSTNHFFGPLAIGDYYYQVTGIASGLAGGLYSLTSTLAPVPEPETYALMLAGLGVIGFLARRRRPQA